MSPLAPLGQSKYAILIKAIGGHLSAISNNIFPLGADG
jgi:hypothetical protein